MFDPTCDRRNIIEYNSFNDIKQLPYIEISQPPLKLLLDTGATKSLLDPNIAEKYFANKIYNEKFTISTAFKEHHLNSCADIPFFAEFNENSDIKFYLFKFHEYFDGLIGFDIIANLGMQVDFKNSIIFTANAEIPIKYRETPKLQDYCYNLKANSITQIKIPVKISNGEILIQSQEFYGCNVPEIITLAENNFAIIEITNPTDHDITIRIHEPVDAIPLENFKNHYEFYNLNFQTYDQNIDKTKITSLLRTEHMNSEEKNSIIQLCKNFKDIFFYEDTKLTFTNQVKHKINTTDEIPVHSKTYRYPYIHKPEVEKQISKMLNDGIIQPSNSPWSSPIWIVPKKQDASGKQKWRIVVDYRKLNEKTIDDRYPLPNISDILDKLGRSQYFTTLDLASGFHQIEMSPEDIPKTAFSVEHGHYEYLRMPFGLKNAPSTFQRAMDDVLKGLQGHICLVYMDDIIIFSTSLPEHIENLRKVFQRLRDKNLKIQLDKSEFLQKNVKFLGHIITPEGIKPNPDKIAAIKKFPVPKTPKEIKSFLGLIGYYRKFIKDFAKLTKPLTTCLKKGAKIEHDEKFLHSFETCKNILTNDPLLQYPDFDKPFVVTTDASQFAIGGILSQGNIGSDKPIAYASRTLNNAEINYSVIEKELLGIIYAVKYFRPYLFGRKFKIVTDHKPLQWLFSLKEPQSRLVRWRLKLEEYDYEIVYKKGKNNTNADALSRVQIHPLDTQNIDKETNLDEQSMINNIDSNDYDTSDTDRDLDNQSMINNFDSNEERISDTDRDRDKQTMPNNTDEHKELRVTQPDSDNITVHTTSEDPIQTIQISEKAINYYDNQIFINELDLDMTDRFSILESFHNKQKWQCYFTTTNTRQQFIDLLKNYCVPGKTYAFYIENEQLYPILCNAVKDTFKNSTFKLIKCTKVLKDVFSEKEQTDLIKYYHEIATVHRGINELESELRRQYFWPTLRIASRNYVNRCEICQTTKYERNPINPKLELTPTPEKPFEIIHMDTLTIENKKFLILIDSFSKYAQAYPLTGTQAVNVVQCLVTFMSHHGLPKLIITDNGTEFKNEIIADFADLHGIKTHYTTPLHPNSNGIVERFNSTLLEHIRIIKAESNKIPLCDVIPYAILGYNNSIHSVTKMKPLEIITGHLEVNDPFNVKLNKDFMTDYILQHKKKLNLMYEQIHEQMVTNKQKIIEKRNLTKEKPPDIDITNPIFVKKSQRNKTAPRYKKDIALGQSKNKIYTHKSKFHKQQLKRPRLIQSKPLQVFQSKDNAPNDDTAIPADNEPKPSCSGINN